MTMTAAMIKVHEARDQNHVGWTKLTNCDGSVAAYFTQSKNPEHWLAYGYTGRKKSHSTMLFRKSFDECYEWAKKFISEYERNNTKATNTLKVGDVLYSSWGYEQTNIDYYKVVAVKGKTMVGVVKLGEIRNVGDMQGTSVPDVSNIIGDVFYRKVNNNAVKINEIETASLHEDFEISSGIKLYKPKEFTSYA